MFAIAVWDGRAGRLVLARDRFGIKPLYYLETADGGLAFASELKALMELPEFDRALDMRALESLLAFNSIPGPLTIFDGVRKLQPGHLLSWEPGRGATVRPYAQVTPAPADELRDDSQAALADELRERLRDSVRAHLVSDVPVGVLLSGGRRLGHARRAGRRRRAESACARSRSASASARSTSWSEPAWWRAATTPTTTSSSSSRTWGRC